MKKLLLLLAFAVMLTAFSGCGAKIPENSVASPEELSGKTVGVPENSSAAYYAEKAGAYCVEYEDEKNLLADLLAGNLDCAAASENTAKRLLSESGRVKQLSSSLADETYRFITALENPDLASDLDAALSAIKADGTLKGLTDACLSGEKCPENAVPEDAEALTVAVTPEFPPYCFTDEDGNLCGLDVETAKAVCARIGLRAEFSEVASDKAVSAVQNGRAAFAAGRFAEDEETQVLFSAPYMQTSLKIIVRK